ncbi:MAG: AAC(3) family N-acetyltransferase [Acidobacteriota bacterium]
MVHSSFKEYSGFQGSLEGIIDVFQHSVSPGGNLMMVSLPYTSYTYEYLRDLRCFDVRKTPSRMGLISEAFRRRRDVLRSLHPTHPVLAWGPKASWIVADHETATYPCGKGTPYEKLAQVRGKVLFFDTVFFVFTFFHYLEELVKDDLDFALYFDAPYEVPVIDADGRRGVVTTRAYSLEAIRRRRPEVLKAELERLGWLKKDRVGNSRLMLVETDQAIQCTKQMQQKGVLFYTRD